MNALHTLYSPLRVLLVSAPESAAEAEISAALSRMHPAGELQRIDTAPGLREAYCARACDLILVDAAVAGGVAALAAVFQVAAVRESFVVGCVLGDAGAALPNMGRSVFLDHWPLPLEREGLAGKLHAIRAFRQLWLGYAETARLQAGMLDQINDGALLLDDQGLVRQANRAACQVLAMAAHDLVGVGIPSSLKDGGAFEQLLPLLRLPAGYPGQLLLFRPSGLSDRTAAAAAAVTEAVAPDVLTGLPTHLLMQDRLAKAVQMAARYSRNIGVLLVDVDRFALVNSEFGYAVGDQVLRVLAQRLQGVVRSVDTVAREDGGRFVIMLQELTRPEDALYVASRIRTVCQEAILLSDAPTLRLSVSIGIARFPDHGKTALDLLRRAETALRGAKQGGANQIYCYSVAADDAGDRALIETQLLAALDANEFEVYYQPKLDLASGTVVGAEALIRWNFQGELRYPDKFIPLAEEMGVINRISQWVIREAVRQLDCWTQAGYDFTVAVNVSPKEFTDELLHLVRAALAEFDVAPARLEIEITESALADNPEEAARVMEALCALGVRLSIDDFGTGYSSLARIKSFPLHVLKIDRSFIVSIQHARLQDDAILCPPEAEKDLAIVRAIVSIAQNLDLSTVAEGVELPDQLAVLGALGVKGWQGYYAAKPMPAKNFIGWVEHWRTARARQPVAAAILA